MAAITTLSSSSTATFTASGLASGLDTNSIIDQLVTLESRPITLAQSQQTAIKTQVSQLATLISKLSALATAADDLGKNGLFAAKLSSTNTAFSVAPGTDAVQGRYSVEVEALARAAKWRSDGFAATDSLAAGTLRLTVQGKTYPPADGTAGPILITQGESLADVAFSIRQSGAPVSAAILTDGNGRSYLSITDRDTGVPLDGGKDLAVTFTRANGATGNSLDFGTPTVQAGQNAAVWVDGLRFVRPSNVVSDALPGATLTLQKEAPGAAEDVVLTTDTDATQKRLQTFVDAYNGVMSLVQKQEATNKDADRASSLTGVSSVRSLQAQLQRLVVSNVSGLANVKNLADLGISTSKDSGSLSIDGARFQKALATDPQAVNSIFSTAGSGLASLVDGLVSRNTRSSDGALVVSQDSLNQRVKDLDDSIATMQSRVDTFRQNLVAQFAAMETTVSGLKTMGTFLTSWANQNSSSSSK